MSALTLAACATQNKFTSNVVEYNTESERAQDTAILLNVIRASRRRPLQFFDITTVTGASPASGSLGLSIPLSQNHTTSRAPTSAAPMLSLSGGPAVAAGPITTQDFYKGVLAPIPLTTVDYLVQRGLGRELLFNLLFAKIRIYSDDADTPGDRRLDVSLVNDPDHPEDFAAFQKVVEMLVDANLTTRRSGGESGAYGPVLFPAQLAQGDLVARAAAAGLQTVAVSWCDLAPADQLELAVRIATGGGPRAPRDAKAILEGMNGKNQVCDRLKQAEKTLATATEDETRSRSRSDIETQWLSAAANFGVPAELFRLEKPSDAAGAEFCFDDSRTAAESGPGLKNQCEDAAGPSGAHTARSGGAEGKAKADSVSAGFLSAPMKGEETGDRQSIFCAAISMSRKEISNQCAATAPVHIKLDFSPRSVYSVLYYLGEVVRQETYPDGDQPVFQVRFRRSGSPAARPAPSCAPAVAEGADCAPLFWVANSDAPGFLSVSYDGRRYVVPDTPHDAPWSQRSDMTYEVMDIVTELLDLNRSAKDLPTSNVFSLQGLP